MFEERQKQDSTSVICPSRMTAHVTGAFFALPLFLPPFRLGNAAMHALCVFRIASGKIWSQWDFTN